MDDLVVVFRVVLLNYLVDLFYVCDLLSLVDWIDLIDSIDLGSGSLTDLVGWVVLAGLIVLD